eukprot:282943-Prorocentrum_minimum.AAC.1
MQRHGLDGARDGELLQHRLRLPPLLHYPLQRGTRLEDGALDLNVARGEAVHGHPLHGRVLHQLAALMGAVVLRPRLRLRLRPLLNRQLPRLKEPREPTV